LTWKAEVGNISRTEHTGNLPCRARNIKGRGTSRSRVFGTAKT